MAITMGTFYNLAIGTDGNLYAWGDNTSGQLGDGTTNAQLAPEVITFAAGIRPTVISAGGGHSLAIGSDGNLYAWGANAVGELGDGTTISHLTPEVITLASGVTATAISASSSEFNLAIGSDGNLYAWGGNSPYGTLGDGTLVNQTSPEQITLAQGVMPTEINTGGYFSLAIGSSGPPSNIPEVPIAVELPGAAALLMATAAVIGRRQRRSGRSVWESSPRGRRRAGYACQW